MSMPSRVASSVALPSARTLKPRTMTSEAIARLMSPSVIAPTPRCSTRSWTSSPTSIFMSASSRASTVPELSPLMIRLSSLVSLSAASRSSRLTRLRRPPRRAVRFRAGARAAARQLRVALAGATAVGDLPGHAVLVDDEERVAGARHRREADDLHRTGGQRLLHVRAELVEHPSHASRRVAGDDRVADVQRAALDQHRGHGPAAAVEVRLD